MGVATSCACYLRHGNWRYCHIIMRVPIGARRCWHKGLINGRTEGLATAIYLYCYLDYFSFIRHANVGAKAKGLHCIPHKRHSHLKYTAVSNVAATAIDNYTVIVIQPSETHGMQQLQIPRRGKAAHM